MVWFCLKTVLFSIISFCLNMPCVCLIGNDMFLFGSAHAGDGHDADDDGDYFNWHD